MVIDEDEELDHAGRPMGVPSTVDSEVWYGEETVQKSGNAVDGNEGRHLWSEGGAGSWRCC